MTEESRSEEFDQPEETDEMQEHDSTEGRVGQDDDATVTEWGKESFTASDPPANY